MENNRALKKLKKCNLVKSARDVVGTYEKKGKKVNVR
jgi:hypothetical protein